MDHFSKALEHARRDGRSVRDWIQPSPAQAAPAETVEPSLVGRRARLDPTHLHRHHVLTGRDIDDRVIADRYRVLRTQLVQRMKANGWSRLAITSPGPKAGKTLTSTNLAISIARDGSQRVVLVDADLRKPTIGQNLGLGPGPGLVDYLTGDASLEEVIVAVEGIPNLTIVPGRALASADPKPELLKSPRMLALLERAARDDRSTIVITDLPPVFVGDDVIVLADFMHGVLLIVEEGVTEIDELKDAVELLSKFNLIGTVLNNSREKQKTAADYYYAASADQQDRSR